MTGGDLGLITAPFTAGAQQGDHGIVLESQRLVPSATGRRCSLQGTLFNNNSFPIQSLRVDLRAFNSNVAEIAIARITELSVEAGGRVAYDSSAFSPDIACSEIARVERLSTRITRP